MSAHMVSDATITALVDVAILGPAPDGWDWAGAPVPAYSADELGTQLIEVNVASLKARYPEDWEAMSRDPEAAYEWPGLDAAYKPLTSRRKPTAVEALKLIAHWRYQSCEWPAWETSPAGQTMRTLEHRLIQNLPGYDEAPWGWERL